MDEDEIKSLIQACKLLKYKFCGVFAADNFPLKLSQNRFIIVNVSSSDSIGTHLTLLCRKNAAITFLLIRLDRNYHHTNVCTTDWPLMLLIFKTCMNC